MELAAERPNVELREHPSIGTVVVLAFPYDERIVAAVRRVPGRRFDWSAREWWAPADEWSGAHVLSILERFPDLAPSGDVRSWLTKIEGRWVARVTTRRHDGCGWWVLDTWAGEIPGALRTNCREVDGLTLAPLTAEGALALDEQRSIRLDAPAQRCLDSLLIGRPPPGARLCATRGVAGAQLVLEVLWDGEAGDAFDSLPGAKARSVAPDPWIAERLDSFIAMHSVAIDATARPVLDELHHAADAAAADVRASRATAAEPLAHVSSALGGELEPFQWAAVRYALDRRRVFLADEQGLGKTVEALATLEADDAFPAVVVCPASLKLNWERETRRWLPLRTTAVVQAGMAVPPAADVVILNYELVAKHEGALRRLSPRALVIDESHYCKNPRAKRTQAVRRVAESLPEESLRLALTGTPVLNHAEELISQLRVLGRLSDFGSGARFAREFEGAEFEERVHWHLRRRCFVRRVKRDVMPQLPPKRQVVVPVALTNETEYRLAEDDVIKWLRQQPLDLAELNAKIAATLRAERLAQLGTLQRLAAAGKLHGALAWIHDFLHSGEPLVVFARHRIVLEAVRERFPEALHMLGTDSAMQREDAVRSFQDPEGPTLIVCSSRVAAQGITLTRASNVAFLELEWTPAMHDQAEDRCHRIGQRDAVTAYYLLAAGTIDETMARLIQRKRTAIASVTDGRRLDADGLVAAVISELREGRPFRHLHATATR